MQFYKIVQMLLCLCSRDYMGKVSWGYIARTYKHTLMACILMCFRWWVCVPCCGPCHKFGPITRPISSLIGLAFCYPWYKLHLCPLSIALWLCHGNGMFISVWSPNLDAIISVKESSKSTWLSSSYSPFSSIFQNSLK